MNKTVLSGIRPGQNAMVTEVKNCGSIRKRFMDLGLIRGCCVCCILSSGGSMKAYNIRGAVIAIRDRDAESITVEVESDEDGSPCR